jgi:hypothetical protein
VRLQGLTNRAQPVIYIFSEPIDPLWFQTLTSTGGWLSNATIVALTSLEQVVQLYVNLTESGALGALRIDPGSRTPLASGPGVVLYDPAVWPTSLLASTAAGVEDLLPVAFRPNDTASLYYRLGKCKNRRNQQQIAFV